MVREPRTGAPTASASRRELQPGVLPGCFAGQTGDSPPAASAAAMCPIDGPAILLTPFCPFLDDTSRRVVTRPNASAQDLPNDICFSFDTSTRSNLT
ncbi:hypothetical protein [Burkholderia sp. MSMB1078WGS]|uniref:hypothetical protein n=1 Tax=Burkholderia sp. MSMB1078WGS TaxID=1637900 RepID=UPI000755BF4A|nr:hypothetical protein [Burkholderia sp. MSMB1078WGS]